MEWVLGDDKMTRASLSYGLLGEKAAVASFVLYYVYMPVRTVNNKAVSGISAWTKVSCDIKYSNSHPFSCDLWMYNTGLQKPFRQSRPLLTSYTLCIRTLFINKWIDNGICTSECKYQYGYLRQNTPITIVPARRRK